ncbi:MAG TPA: multidrug efflux MFS transporter [Bacteroidales bacterium]|nr:multidrug efflux MFS transporter [Bacteroidales bacterium]
MKNVLQSRFTGAVLDLDQLHNASLKWLEFLGSLLGTLFAWFTLTRLQWSKKILLFIGMSAVVLYVGLSYFIITPYTSIQMLYLPLILLGFGQLVVFISLTVYAQATTPFNYYFQVLALLGFIRTGVASPIGDAILNRAMTGLMSKHLSIVGVGSNAFLLALRELYGWVFIFGIIVLILIAISRFKKYIPRPIPSLMRLSKIFTQF